MHPSPEVLALLALGEVGAASASEHHHIDTCSSCSSELSELSHLTSIGRSVNGSDHLLTPDPAVWVRIRTELGFAADPATPDVAVARPRAAAASPPVLTPVPPTLTPVPAALAAVPAGRRPTRRRQILAVAVVLALIVGVGAGIGFERLRQPVGTVLAQAQLRALPDWSGSTGTAKLERDADGNRILMVSIDATRPLSGTQQVWLVDPADPSQMRHLGALNVTEGQWPVPAGIDVTRFSLVDVSEEPVDDPSVVHSGNSIVRGPLQP